MSGQLEVPRLDDLSDLPLEVDTPGQPGVVALTAWATDGSSVTLTWDECAGSATLRWLHEGHERLVLERETASKVSVRNDGGGIQFRVWSRADGLSGELLVQVNDRVAVSDSLLRA